MYPEDTNEILKFLGYVSGSDYDLYMDETGLQMRWYSSDPQPTPADINAQLLPYLEDAATEKAKQNRREAWRTLRDTEFEDIEDFHYYITLYTDNDQVAKTKFKSLGDSAANLQTSYDAEIAQVATWVAASDVQSLRDFIAA